MKNAIWIALVVVIAPPAFAQTQAPIAEGCIGIDPPRQISSMCDFQEGVPMYGTRVKTNDTVGCPSEIIVEYPNPETKGTSLWVANRRGTTIYTCGSGVASARISGKNDGGAGGGSVSAPAAVARVPDAPAPPSRPDEQRRTEEPPPKTELWNAVAGSTYRVRGVVQVAIGYARNVSRDRARDNAIAQCEDAGGRTCKVTGPFNFGCLYITTGRDRRGAGWYSSATSDGATDRCRETGKKCKVPIGGCVDAN